MAIAATTGWSDPLPVTVGTRVTVTPGAGGSVALQWSSDGTNWVNFLNSPLRTASTFATPALATSIRSMAFTSAGTFATLPVVSTNALSTSPIGALLRAGIAQALQGNPLDLAPWTADVAWTINTVYIAGAVVANGGNRYICTVAGTSAGAGGPSGTTYAPIVDNTARWEYAGPAQTGVSGAPTVVVDTTDRSATYTRSYGPSLSASGTVNSDTAFNFRSGEPYVFNALTPISVAQWSATTTNINTGRAARFGQSVEFCTDAQDLVIELLFSSFGGEHRLIVDGRFVNFGVQPSGAATRTTILITFNTYAPIHTVVVEGTSNTGFRLVRVRPTNTVWAPPKVGPAVWTVGNSFFTGGDGFPVNTSILGAVSHFLGAHKMIDASVGGTGFDTAGSARSFSLRLDEAARFAPDVILIQSSFFTDTTAAQTQSTMAAFLSALRGYSVLWQVPVFVIGDFGAAAGPSAQTIARETGMLAAITAFGDPLVFGIANSTDLPNPWIRGTGNAGAPNGSGNSDLFINSVGTHHNHVGSMWYAKRIAQAVIRTVAAAT